MNRYLEIMRRTGLPVIIATDSGEPIVLLPLDTYEMLIGGSAQYNYNHGENSHTQIRDGLETKVNEINAPTAETGMAMTDISEETTKKQGKQGENNPSPVSSVEDRFFLDPIE